MTTALVPLALDAYLPAFPAIADALSASVHEISLSISVYVFFLAFGQLIGGPLSDRVGRATVMLTGLAIFVTASYLLSKTVSLEFFLLLRIIQAFGGGWATVCVAALVRDRLSGNEAARFFSLIGLIMVAAPALAPSIGNLFLVIFGWESIFLVLAIYALSMIVILKMSVFARSSTPTKSHSHVSIWQRYGAVFAKRAALRFMLLQSLAFSVMLLFITHASFIYQEHFGLGSQTFALLFGANIVFMMIMNLVNRKLLKTVLAVNVLRWGLTLQATGIAMLILVMVFHPNVYLFVPAMIITVGSMGVITSNTQACFMEFFTEHAGTASALLGAATFSVAGTISALSALIPQTVIAVVLAQAVCSLVCLSLIWSDKKRMTEWA